VDEVSGNKPSVNGAYSFACSYEIRKRHVLCK